MPDLLLRLVEKSLVNAEPYGDGWMVVIRPSDASELNGLLDAAAYRTFTEDEAH